VAEARRAIVAAASQLRGRGLVPRQDELQITRQVVPDAETEQFAQRLGTRLAGQEFAVAVRWQWPQA
jgi:hypothetical protein